MAETALESGVLIHPSCIGDQLAVWSKVVSPVNFATGRRVLTPGFSQRYRKGSSGFLETSERRETSRAPRFACVPNRRQIACRNLGKSRRFFAVAVPRLPQRKRGRSMLTAEDKV
jgi:hypothetical protein